jgi:23S rRNA pseudouridine1911/1915/1917 synthase
MYKITIDNQGVRLDKFLTENLPDLTRSQIKKQLQSGFILVNGEIPTVHRFLKAGDRVEVLPVKQVETVDFVAPEVIAETGEYLILEKPAGLIMHPTDNTREKTLTDWLIEEYPDLKNVYDHGSPIGHVRPGIVHRLDKEVSGLVLVAKTQTAFDHFKEQFKTRQVTKKYQGLEQMT